MNTYPRTPTKIRTRYQVILIMICSIYLTVIGSDIMLLSQGACRICNFVRLNAILQHGTLCTLLNNIPPLITESSSQDYTWAFFCRFVPLGALFDSPCRGPLPMIQLSSDRAHLVEKLEADFVENPSNINAMSWLHGPSGTGKSVIAYTLASRCRQKNRLAGSFFFSRRHANCRSARSLVFALAYQLGLSQPQAKEKIIEALDNDPGIISPSRDLREQFARLLIEPLEAVDWRPSSRVFVFVIDAIDQCQDQMPELISLLTRLLSHMIDVGLRIFFTSRDHVGVLIKRHLPPMSSDIALDRTVITGDVRLFFRQSFDKIHKRHRLQCRKPWPPEEVLGRLADRVGPYFITGSIIVKFVESLDHDPTDRMDLIDHIPLDPSSPSETSIDDFYKYIISTADDVEQAYLHLTIVVNLAGMLSFSQLDDLLNRGSNQKFDMHSALSQLSPLVHIPDGHDSAVQVCHESLCDFLSNPLRCGKQFTSKALVHRLLAYSSLSVMIEELPNNSDLCSRLSRLATESGSVSLCAFDNAEVLSFAMYSPPEPLPFLSMLWHIMQHQYMGLQVDSRTKLALLYFCRTWQILQHIDLSAVGTLPAFRFLANIQSLPVLLAFPIFLAFESPRSGQTLGPSTLEYDPRMETLDAVVKIVTDVYALKDQRKTGSSALDYACSHWAYHLSLAEWDDDLRSVVTVFMRRKLQQWLVKAWCLQDLETCLRTLCEVQELCLAANPPIHFDPDAQRTDANTKAEHEAEKAEVARQSIKGTTEDVQILFNIGAGSSSWRSSAPRSAVDRLSLDAGPSPKVLGSILGRPQASIDIPDIASPGSGIFPFAQSYEYDTRHLSLFPIAESSSSIQPSEQLSPLDILYPRTSSPLFTCLWLADYTCCGRLATLEDLKKHVKTVHLPVLQQDVLIKCRWEGCNNHNSMQCHSIWRHIQETHLGRRRVSRIGEAQTRNDERERRLGIGSKDYMVRR
ncbi:hypothetical protein DFJ58DRAFT_280853 [Suillus subalutaceus]|uniref:uncharacterized protein n=1 Tax=Suillus subalutaceus TaxID=48586 RepID=UPI001B86DD47|nr:uncharacterized protein DFJ58DRAFT_280853 [Suillus subalutaceus]KAG1860205.1 hypothetical protein DFJ58DRAFT_280853 [Suillus subalutaceus]